MGVGDKDWTPVTPKAAVPQMPLAQPPAFKSEGSAPASGPGSAGDMNDRQMTQYENLQKKLLGTTDKPGILDRQMKLAEDAQTADIWGQFGTKIATFIMDGFKTFYGYKATMEALDVQRNTVNRQFDVMDKTVALQQNVANSQEKIALGQQQTIRAIAETQKDRDIAIAKAKANAAVQINKTNAQFAIYNPQQFYGQPAQSFV